MAAGSGLPRSGLPIERPRRIESPTWPSMPSTGSTTRIDMTITTGLLNGVRAIVPGGKVA